jgi:putative ABC transport system substrate-binding protein
MTCAHAGRRQLLAGVGCAALSPRLLAQAAAPRKLRIAWLAGLDLFDQPYSRAFVQRLRELGYEEGRNLVIEHRHAGGQAERVPAVAAELAREPVDLWFAPGEDGILAAAAQAPGAAPIVVVAADYEPGTVTVATGRATGVVLVQPQLPAQRLVVFVEALPKKPTRLAVLGNPSTADQLSVLRTAADRLGIELQVVDLGPPPIDFAAGFAQAAAAKPDGVVVLGSAQFVPGRRLLPELALRAGLPSLFTQPQWVDAGGLMSYGISFPKLWRRAAEMAAALLGGARAADIPFEPARGFELVLNRKTAQALNLTFTPSVLARADRIIE